jgi:hypothetical protein
MSPPPTTDESETQTSQSRRRFLLGVSAVTAAVAGCTSRGDTGSDGPADSTTTESFDPASDLSYGRWLTTARDGMLFASADLEAIPTNSASDTSAEAFPEDPLVAYPFLMGQTTVGIGQLQLSLAGLTDAIAPEGQSDSTITRVTVINRTVVGEGTLATDKLHERLTAPADETYGIVYEQTDPAHGYDLYEPAEVPDSISDPPAVALGDESVVVSPGTDQRNRMVAAGSGNQTRIYETDDTVAQLLEAAGTGDIVVGEVGSLGDGSRDPGETFDVDPQFEPRSDEDVVASLEFGDGGDTVESQFALAADDLAESRRETIETAFGTAAVDGSASVDVTDDRVTADGTFDGGSLGLTSGERSGDEDPSQVEATELVSPDALAFQYEPPRDQRFGELWVRVTDDTDAAALQLDAASGGSTEFRPQERSVSAGDSVAVRVDPDGDSVTVSAVADEGAVGELTTQSVPTDTLSEDAADQAVPADALSFSYESPDGGDLGSLTVEVVADTDAETLVAQPQEAPGLFTDRVGSLTADEPVGTGTTLETAVDPDGDEVVVYATVDGATGEVARWQGPP